GQAVAPAVGDTIKSVDGQIRTWQAVQAGPDGSLSHAALNGGYAYCRVEVLAPRIMLLDAAGHSMGYVNGEPRMGDVYSLGYVRLPVWRRAGANHLLFAVGRGKLRAKLTQPAAELLINGGDFTLPDLVIGESDAVSAAVPIINSTTSEQSSAFLIAECNGGD